MGGERVQIRIGGQSIAAEKGANLMQALVTDDVLLRSDCGGRCRCGKCLVRAEGPGPDRVSPPENRERELLSEESLHAGWRLACCTRVFGPIAIETSVGSLLVPEVVQKGSPTVVAGFSLQMHHVKAHWWDGGRAGKANGGLERSYWRILERFTKVEQLKVNKRLLYRTIPTTPPLRPIGPMEPSAVLCKV